MVVLAAFVGGLIYAFGSYRMVYAALGYHNQWSTMWIPFYALYLFRTSHEPQLRSSFAVVGFQGAVPGTALEEAGPGEGWLRVAPDRRTLAIAVDTIGWEQLGP